jgi:hypothetical protein
VAILFARRKIMLSHTEKSAFVTALLTTVRFSFRSLKVIVALAVLIFACEAHAATVGCNGAPAGTYDFSTLTAAVNGAPLSNNTITIYGTCTEDVVINGAQNLTIAGSAGAVLLDAGLTNSLAAGVLEIDNSQNVAIQNLKIQLISYSFYGPFPGIVVNSSLITVQQVDIEGNSGTDGIDINSMSHVQFLTSNTIENNNDGQGNGEGVSLSGPAASMAFGNGPAGCLLIQGNGDDGILASGQASVSIATRPNHCATIQNNGNFGVQASGSSTAGLNTPGTTSLLIISGNMAGVAATLGGHVQLAGPILIQNNSVAGIWLRDSSMNMLPSPQGPIIQQNGGNSNPPCCLIPGGISAQGNSNVFVQAGTVTNNLAPGINIQDASSAIIYSAGPISITQNPVGVSVTNASTVALYSAPNISGNANGDVVCGAYSVAYGDASAVGQMHCTVFSPGPKGQGGNISKGNSWH